MRNQSYQLYLLLLLNLLNQSSLLLNLMDQSYQLYLFLQLCYRELLMRNPMRNMLRNLNMLRPVVRGSTPTGQSACRWSVKSTSVPEKCKELSGTGGWAG